MKVTSLVDNVAGRCCGEHGLSLWIELSDGRKVLFDTGQGALFLENARYLGIDVSDADALVISHGHYDHIGGLKTFFEVNSKAKVYVRPGALCPHFSLKDSGLKDIGCADDVSRFSDRIVICQDRYTISPDLVLLANTSDLFPRPRGNSNLFASDAVTPDDFSHEQSLLVSDGGKHYLFAGCAHCGAANILATAQKLAGQVDVMLTGMHLMKGSDETEGETIARQLAAYGDCRFVTMHCTGYDNFLILKRILDSRISYLPSGDSLCF
ncbi:MAG: MBL fold metallo-hydrolase [Bacteroidia bacterium]|nr:MBL fold metallo-hydrolase [Bacteroidia bacterium]